MLMILNFGKLLLTSIGSCSLPLSSLDILSSWSAALRCSSSLNWEAGWDIWHFGWLGGNQETKSDDQSQ